MKEPIWLLKQALLATHSQMILEFGGTSGIRDEGLLDSALNRPIDIFNYDDKVDIHKLAASYATGIIKNHPFIDGNKRTGFISAYLFLGRNGLRITADQITATAMTLDLAESEIDEKAYAIWLGQYTEARG
jgi:death-on-curing protein